MITPRPSYSRATFISPALYREFFYPWHRRLVELCHDYGAYVNIHSHGNINAIMPLLYEASIDILNPVGPSDGMDLAELKVRYGDRITFNVYLYLLLRRQLARLFGRR